MLLYTTVPQCGKKGRSLSYSITTLFSLDLDVSQSSSAVHWLLNHQNSLKVVLYETKYIYMINIYAADIAGVSLFFSTRSIDCLTSREREGR